MCLRLRKSVAPVVGSVPFFQVNLTLHDEAGARLGTNLWNKVSQRGRPLPPDPLSPWEGGPGRP